MFDIMVFALSHPRTNESYEWQGLPVQCFGACCKGSWLPVSLVSLVKQHSKTKFDLIHAYWATEPGLVGTLAKRIFGIPLLPELCQSFGTASLAIAQEKLNRLKQVPKLINLYTKMVGEKA